MIVHPRPTYGKGERPTYPTDLPETFVLVETFQFQRNRENVGVGTRENRVSTGRPEDFPTPTRLGVHL